MQFRPGFDESMLASWEGTTDQLNGVNAINAHSLLVVRVKMRPVMWRTGFSIHANNNPKKAGKFWHDLIIPQGCGVVVSPYCGGRDRTAARATLGGEFPALALSIREAGA
jgi:hypothetical protein